MYISLKYIIVVINFFFVVEKEEKKELKWDTFYSAYENEQMNFFINILLSIIVDYLVCKSLFCCCFFLSRFQNCCIIYSIFTSNNNNRM
jgi:hypothetical protein